MDGGERGASLLEDFRLIAARARLFTLLVDKNTLFLDYHSTKDHPPNLIDEFRQ